MLNKKNTSEQEEEGFTEEDPSPSLFKLFNEECYKNRLTSYSRNQSISKSETLKEDKENLLWFESAILDASRLTLLDSSLDPSFCDNCQ